VKRLVVVSILVFILVLVVTFLLPVWHYTAYRDRNVVAIRKYSLFSLISVHSAPQNQLKIGGKVYPNVRGLPPFYLNIPQIRSILFVTSEDQSGMVFHIVNTNTWEEISIFGAKSSFGWEIGFPTNRSSYADFVESANSNVVIAVSTYTDAKKVYYLNLSSQKLDKMVYDEFDAGGRIKKEDVYK